MSRRQNTGSGTLEEWNHQDELPAGCTHLKSAVHANTCAEALCCALEPNGCISASHVVSSAEANMLGASQPAWFVEVGRPWQRMHDWSVFVSAWLCTDTLRVIGGSGCAVSILHVATIHPARPVLDCFRTVCMPSSLPSR